VSVCLGSAHLIPDSELSVGLSNARAAVTVLNYFFSCISLRGCVFTYDAFIKAGAPERAFEKQATHHYHACSRARVDGLCFIITQGDIKFAS